MAGDANSNFGVFFESIVVRIKKGEGRGGDHINDDSRNNCKYNFGKRIVIHFTNGGVSDVEFRHTHSSIIIKAD